ncbi:MAG: hypothetical protein OEY23_25385 [Acidimicrobiia bacterium]|nr:hypothetical protein [Acidimicrobiia bacterium]
METRRWTNPSQPQTLQIGVFLLYLNAAFGLLLRQANAYALLGGGFLFIALAYLAMVAAGFGIANNQRWGYYVGVGVTVGEVVLLLSLGLGILLSSGLITLLFAGARAALLLHPMSRSYQKVWFK